MSEISDRFRKVAGGFARRAESVDPDAWSRPSPCEGWDARDVVRLWWGGPPFLRSGAGLELPAGPSVDENPVAAWTVFCAGVQDVLDDPAVSESEFHDERTRTHRVDAAIDMFVLGDVLIHTWDLARATGQDDIPDPDEVRRMRAGREGLGDLLVQSGHYAPAIGVADDADEQTRLIALTGRRP
jgi:uncharacterized protein (TIGR03086 family)